MGVACGEQAAEFGVGVFAEPFMGRNEQPPRPIERVVFAATVAEGVVLGFDAVSRRGCCWRKRIT